LPGSSDEGKREMKIGIIHPPGPDRASKMREAMREGKSLQRGGLLAKKLAGVSVKGSS